MGHLELAAAARVFDLSVVLVPLAAADPPTHHGLVSYPGCGALAVSTRTKGSIPGRAKAGKAPSGAGIEATKVTLFTMWGGRNVVREPSIAERASVVAAASGAGESQQSEDCSGAAEPPVRRLLDDEVTSQDLEHVDPVKAPVSVKGRVRRTRWHAKFCGYVPWSGLMRANNRCCGPWNQATGARTAAGALHRGSTALTPELSSAHLQAIGAASQ